MKKTKILSFGVNQSPNSDYITPGIHAEQDAINKLKPLKPDGQNYQLKTFSVNLRINDPPVVL